MHSRRQSELIGGTTLLAGVPRRRLLQGAGALGLAAILRPAAVFAEPDDDDNERLGPFGPWSTPVNLGPVVNTRYSEGWAAISKNGLSLYLTSDRPGGVNGKNPTGLIEIWVSQRASLDADWGPPVNLDAFNRTPVINVIGYGTAVPSFSTMAICCSSTVTDQGVWAPVISIFLDEATSTTISAGKSRLTLARSIVRKTITPRLTSRTKRRGSSACTSRLTVREGPSGVPPAASTSGSARWAMMARSVPPSSSRS